VRTVYDDRIGSCNRRYANNLLRRKIGRAKDKSARNAVELNQRERSGQLLVRCKQYAASTQRLELAAKYGRGRELGYVNCGIAALESAGYGSRVSVRLRNARP
jgi:hypothetical protein